MAIMINSAKEVRAIQSRAEKKAAAQRKTAAAKKVRYIVRTAKKYAKKHPKEKEYSFTVHFNLANTVEAMLQKRGFITRTEKLYGQSDLTLYVQW